MAGRIFVEMVLKTALVSAIVHNGMKKYKEIHHG